MREGIAATMEAGADPGRGERMLRVRAGRVQRADVAIACTLGLVAAALSAAWSWAPSLWGDEAASITSSVRSWPSLLHMLGHVDAVHGVYYAGLHLWVDVFGASAFSVRFPSAIAVGAATALTAILCARLGGRRLAVVAGLACVVLPRMTYAGSEARSYAFSAALAALLTLILVVLLERTRRRWLWFAYAAVLVVGTYLFLYFALIALAHAATLWLRGPGRAFWSRWAVATGAAALACVPIGVAAYLERAQIDWIAQRVVLDAQSVLVDGWFFTVPFAIAAWGLLLAGVAVWLFRWRRLRERDRALEVLAPWMLVPSGVLILSSIALHNFTPRYLTFCAPAAAALIGWSLVQLTARRLVPLAVAAGLVAVLAAPAYLGQRGVYARDDSDWSQLAALVHAHATPGDAIAFDESTRPSRRPRLAMRTYPSQFRGLHDVTLRTPYWKRDTWYDSTYTIAQAAQRGRLGSVARLWLVEYSLDGNTDHWGVADLRALGFTQRATVVSHTSVIEEWVRG